MWATELAEVTWIPVLRGDPSVHSPAGMRGPAVTKLAQVPKAAKIIVGGVRRLGVCHCRMNICPDVLCRIGPEHYPTGSRHPGVARLHHQDHIGGGLVAVYLPFWAAGLMPRVASDRCASATAYDRRIPLKMTMSWSKDIIGHPHGRATSVGPQVVTISIGQG